MKEADGGPRPIGRVQAWRLLQAADQANGLTGKLGTLAMRKTVADRVDERLPPDLVTTPRALGHTHRNAPVSERSCREQEIDAASLAA